MMVFNFHTRRVGLHNLAQRNEIRPSGYSGPICDSAYDAIILTAVARPTPFPLFSSYMDELDPYMNNCTAPYDPKCMCPPPLTWFLFFTPYQFDGNVTGMGMGMILTCIYFFPSLQCSKSSPKPTSKKPTSTILLSLLSVRTSTASSYPLPPCSYPSFLTIYSLYTSTASSKPVTTQTQAAPPPCTSAPGANTGSATACPRRGRSSGRNSPSVTERRL